MSASTGLMIPTPLRREIYYLKPQPQLPQRHACWKGSPTSIDLKFLLLASLKTLPGPMQKKPEESRGGTSEDDACRVVQSRVRSSQGLQAISYDAQRFRSCKVI